MTLKSASFCHHPIPTPALLWAWWAWLWLGGCLAWAAPAPPTSALPDAFRAEDLLWQAELATHHYSIPAFDHERIYIGINDERLTHPALKTTGGGILICLEQSSGQMRWQLPIPRYFEGTKAPFHFDHWKCGVCSTPALQDKRLFIVGCRGDVLCLDRDGQADGNDGPFLQELDYMGVPRDSAYQLTPTDGDILWRFDMIQTLGVVPHDVCGSSPVLHGGCLYACTSNGMDDTHKKPGNPNAPSLIALDAQTGRLRAQDGERIGQRMFHGHWSSPVVTHAAGQDLILFGGGDGVLYAFAPVSRTQQEDPQTLTRIWACDCNPPDYRHRDGQPIPYSSWQGKSPDGPSEIIATPVVWENRVYVAIGQSPIHGPGKGLLSCIDAGTGRKLWETRQVDRTLSNVAIHDGLLYLSDFSGRLHCFDARTGDRCWDHDLGSGVWCASPVVAGGNVYISTEGHVLWVFKAGRNKEVVCRSRVKSMAITPAVHSGALYLPTQKHLFALRLNPLPSGH